MALKTSSATSGGNRRGVIDVPPGISSKAGVDCQPSPLHHGVMMEVLDAGIPFYLEKPVVSDRASWQALGRHLVSIDELPPHVVGCNLRFLPSLERLKDMCMSGALGRIVRATFQAGQWLPSWRPQSDYRGGYSASRKLGGGVICDLVHEMDAARWLLGDFDEVHASAGRFSALEIETEDTAGALLSRQGGPVVHIGLDYVSRKPVREYRLIGERASAVWDLGQELRLELPFGYASHHSRD